MAWGFKHEIAHSSVGRQKETCYLTDLSRNFWKTVTVMGSIPDCNGGILKHIPVCCLSICFKIAVFPNCLFTFMTKVVETLLISPGLFVLLFFSYETALSTLFLFKAGSKHCLCPPALASQMPVTIHCRFLCNKQTIGFDNQKSIPKPYLPPWFVGPSAFF